MGMGVMSPEEEKNSSTKITGLKRFPSIHTSNPVGGIDGPNAAGSDWNLEVTFCGEICRMMKAGNQNVTIEPTCTGIQLVPFVLCT